MPVCIYIYIYVYIHIHAYGLWLVWRPEEYYYESFIQSFRPLHYLHEHLPGLLRQLHTYGDRYQTVHGLGFRV